MGFVRFGSLLMGASLLLACGGGSNSGSSVGTNPGPDPVPGDSGCSGSCASATSFLTQDDIRKIIAQSVNEAHAQGIKATIAIVDRVGNVLAVYRMTGARPVLTIRSNRNVNGGLENLTVPSELAALSKAITGAYLSSEGNAFSTRTASHIVQEHFNPGERGGPAGPLYGVQFSQLPCSDFATRFVDGLGVGPHRAPLGLAADPGGFPLYKGGTPVGGIGIAADDSYSLDLDVRNLDRDLDELLALAGTHSFAAPTDRRADRITLEGKTLRFSDVEFSGLARDPSTAPPFASLGALAGGLIAVPGYYAGAAILQGSAFGQSNSGIRADQTEYAGLDAFVLDDGNGNNRYPPRSGTDGASALSREEVRVLMQQALMVANRSRAQIRRPYSSQARVNISIVDTNGEILAFSRTRDAPIFGADVSLQKARSAMFTSGAFAADDLRNADPTRFLTAAVNLDAGSVALTTLRLREPGDSVNKLRDFLARPNAWSDGAIAFSTRAIGNLSRPLYPDGVDGRDPGPLSLPIAQWSPFELGQQLDLVYNSLALHLAFYLQQAGLTVALDGAALPALADVPQNCTGITRLANGLQIFPGGMPIYRGNVLIGGLGVSGDGIEQDDMISFLGIANTAALLPSLGNAPSTMRADELTPDGARLRYVQCPQSPFIGSTEQYACEGK